MVQLSQDGVRHLLEDNDVEQTLQVLRIIQKEHKEYDAYIVELSDGYTRFTAHFVDQAAKAITEGKILKTSVIRLHGTRIEKTANGSSEIEVLRADPILDKHKGIVGKPMDYPLYKSRGFKNPNGSNNLDDIEKELHEFIKRTYLGEACTNLGFAFVVGLCSAYFLKKLVRIGAFTLGAVGLFLKFLEYHGLITINWKNWIPSINLSGLTKFITFGSAGFAAGFYLGIKKEIYRLM